jgi:hypothetical protein
MLTQAPDRFLCPSYLYVLVVIAFSITLTSSRGFSKPRRKMTVSQEVGNLLLLGLVVLDILAIPSVVSAKVGAKIAKRNGWAPPS